jgi:hypothetical protein
MINNSKDFLMNLWRWKCGLEEIDLDKPVEIINLDELKISEWSSEFEMYMRNRRVLGAIRYGKTNAKGKPKYDRVNTMRRKIDLYEQTKNKEVLVDIANYAMVEFQEPTIDGTYFQATDDQDHDKVKNG